MNHFSFHCPSDSQVVNDDDQENNGEAKTDNDDDSEDGVFGLTTVIDLKKHKVNEREFFKNFSLIVSY